MQKNPKILAAVSLLLLMPVLHIFSYSGSIEEVWPKISLARAGFNEKKIHKLTRNIKTRVFKNIHSLIIIKDSHLVYENYFNGFNKERLHPVYSVTKSISSLLVGIAIDMGMIKTVDEKIKKYLPESLGKYLVKDRAQITLRHLLTMTSGIKWREMISYSSPDNSHYQMTLRKNWVDFVLNQPMTDKPGEKFVYNTGTANFLSLIIKQASNLTIDKFASKYLFDPLGIKSSFWYRDPQGNPCSGGSMGGVFLRSMDLAKIGYLVLKSGHWKGKTVVSEAWIRASSRAQVDNFYGFLWWRSTALYQGRRIEYFYASGYGGQNIYILPPLHLVVVITGGNYGNGQVMAHMQARIMVHSHILGALSKD